jgi:hypothetical protein
MRCPKCAKEMVRRKHGKNQTANLRKAYYYAEWDVCRDCRHVQYYEWFKVFPPKDRAGVRN